MNRLKKFMLAVDKTNAFTGKVMVCILLMAVLFISGEVFSRYILNMPTNWGHECMTLLFAVMYVTIGGYCHYHREHVRVDVFYSSRSPRTKAILDLFTSVFFFIFIGAFTYTGWNFYWSSQTMHGGGQVFGMNVVGELSFTDWAPPLYCVKFMMPLAGVLLLLQGVNWFIRDLYMAITGKEMA